MYDDVCIMQDAPLHMWHAYTTHVAEKCKTHHDDNFRLSSKRMNDKHQYFQCIPFVVFFFVAHISVCLTGARRDTNGFCHIIRCHYRRRRRGLYQTTDIDQPRNEPLFIATVLVAAQHG